MYGKRWRGGLSKMEQPFERMPTVLNAEELINKAFNDSTKVEVELPPRLPAILKAKKREGARVRVVERSITGYLESLVKSVPTVDDMHPFYRDMLDILVGVPVAKSALGRLSRTARIIHEMGRSAMGQLKRARSPSAAATARRAFFGRSSSLIRESAKDLLTIAELRERMKDLPAADPDVPTVVMAGYPGVGKSTIVGMLSSAKPEVRPYPFTTQEIVIGHHMSRGSTIQMVDTPGILDRPLSDRSKTELLAISALGQLADTIAFLVDVSESNGFPLSDQKGLYDDLARTFSGKKILVSFNKTDLASAQQKEHARELFGVCSELSASKGEGLDLFMREVEGALAPRLGQKTGSKN